MRILQVAHYTLPHYGGIEVAVENLARQLAWDGHAVRVLSARVGGKAWEARHGVEFIRVPAWNLLERYAVPYPLFAPSLISEAARLARWAEIVHGHGFLYQSTLVTLGIARIRGRPAVLTEYAGFVRYPQQAWNALQRVAIHTLGRLAVALADLVIVHGMRVHDLIRQLAGPSKAIHPIPLGVDTERFHPATLEDRARLRRALGWDDRPRVLFVGRLVPRKGIEGLLDALDPRYELVLCGRGEMALPDRPGLRVYRSPDDDTLLRVYQAADLFVLPSHSEGAFPLAAQQALACGLPVIAVYDPLYDLYVHPEVVRWIPLDPAAIREAIGELLDERASPRGEERRRKAREWACARLSLRHCIDQHLSLYNSLLINRRKG
jgi:glycosyltransferase involved in cell wall biosynthesis